jgi:hypothetical protein
VSWGQLIALALLGVFHGIDPGMGWLFAVSFGLQERSRRAVVRSLPPIALGHEAAIAIMIVVLTITSSVFASKAVALVGGLILLAFGFWSIRRKQHVRWVGMRLSRWQLAGWSFVMSSAHGAGLMLMTVFAFSMSDGVSPLDIPRYGVLHAVAIGLLAMTVHVGAMIITCGAVALAVYEVLGLRVLRSVWVNLDKVWAFALVGAGVLTLLSV